MGRASREEKDQSRSRIVASAARLFRERGIEGASVNDVMKDAGLTHGGFYRHFASKEALVDSALDAAFEQIVAPLEMSLANQPPETAGRRFREFYLSADHLENAGIGCPAAALASEIAREPDSARGHFTAGVQAMLSTLARTKDGEETEREAAAARDLAMMVGAMTIARASDASLGELILRACRERRA